MDMFEAPRQMTSPRFIPQDEGTTLTLSWEIVRGYDVQDYELFEGDNMVYKGPLSTYTAYNLVSGRFYQYRVKSNNRCGSGELSEPLNYDLAMVSHKQA